MVVKLLKVELDDQLDAFKISLIGTPFEAYVLALLVEWAEKDSILIPASCKTITDCTWPDSVKRPSGCHKQWLLSTYASM